MIAKRSLPTWKRLSVLIALVLFLGACASTGPADDAAGRPAVGQQAPDFTLETVDGEAVRLRELTDDGPVVLVVLRGYIGKQCPLCTRQVGNLLSEADAFSQRDATVVMVYPGKAEGLNDHAKQFLAGKGLPGHFLFVIDPDFEFTNRYGVRWDQGSNTAYPATFVIDKGDREVSFAKISSGAAGRSTANEVLAAIDQEPAEKKSKPVRRPRWWYGR